MEHAHELVRQASARAAAVVAESPVRFSGRAPAPIVYDVDGLDAEKLAYRVGTLALAVAAVPYMLSDAVLKRHWGQVRSSSSVLPSMLAVNLFPRCLHRAQSAAIGSRRSRPRAAR